jgi:glutamate formiminotransferase / 5-formyltetrahydrofolate cyclo-ligase
MIECVINLSEGRRLEIVASLATIAGDDLLDVHADPFHNRSVLTLVGTRAVRSLTREAVGILDLAEHSGVHPRLGTVDVVPFVPLDDATLDDAIAARDDFARWAAQELDVPCFLYGPERTLPEVRRRAWDDLGPDLGPDRPHPRAGAICVGARHVLIAYNVLVDAPDLATVRKLASVVRSAEMRTLGLEVGDGYQVSMNLVAPESVGPAAAFDRVVAAAAPMGVRITGAELVGLAPASALVGVPKSRWAELDLDAERTIEWQLARRLRR